MTLSELTKPDVLEFYRALPFNVHGNIEQSVAAVKSSNSVDNYACLSPLLSVGSKVLEVGCGAGWLSNCMAYYHGARVTAIDFNPAVIEYATSVSETLGLDVEFISSDLFGYVPESAYDVVVSLGVLHHTGNCEAAIRRICREFVRPGGYFFLGLYHKYGRAPFLRHFEALRSSGAGEAELFAEYRRLHSGLTDETHLKSWFRDQVMHPHETQHTLMEVSEVLDSVDMEIVSTSINRFAKIGRISRLFAREKGWEDVARRRLEAGEYFPGFFVTLARRGGRV